MLKKQILDNEKKVSTKLGDSKKRINNHINNTNVLIEKVFTWSVSTVISSEEEIELFLENIEIETDLPDFLVITTRSLLTPYRDRLKKYFPCYVSLDGAYYLFDKEILKNLKECNIKLSQSQNQRWIKLYKFPDELSEEFFKRVLSLLNVLL